MADNGGIITSKALQQMEKLDSFMKETVRFYPPGFSTSVCNSSGRFILLTRYQHPSAVKFSKELRSQTVNTFHLASVSKFLRTPSTKTRPTTPKAIPSTASASTSSVKVALLSTTPATSSSRQMSRIYPSVTGGMLYVNYTQFLVAFAYRTSVLDVFLLPMRSR